MEQKTILVTGIGGNVGQGIIRNIRKSFEDIRIVGCNIDFFSAGNHLCDAFYKVPYACEPSFIEKINKIVEVESINLIIPSTDDEVFYFAQNIAEVKTKVAVSDVKAGELYLDKYLTFLHYTVFNIPFAASFLPSKYTGSFKTSIAKPRKGRGSRGLVIDPVNWSEFHDDEYVIQERYIGEEITTAFYVNKNKQLHGFITLLRDLHNGATIQCKVMSQYDEKIKDILDKIILTTGIKGAANIQSIVTQDGDIFPFEVNCRISGSNSLRSNFGFEDVKYTVQEFLFGKEPDIPKIKKGIGVRILMDVIYPEAEDYFDCLDNTIPFHIF
jgi:carbamoyl-phosphate synthase large subunit